MIISAPQQTRKSRVIAIAVTPITHKKIIQKVEKRCKQPLPPMSPRCP